MNDLKFLQTWSVDEFKTNNHVKEIVIKRNERTGKYFFEYGYETGACSKRVATGELTMPVISQVCSAYWRFIFYVTPTRRDWWSNRICNIMTRRGWW